MDAVQLSHGEWELHLYGRGPMADECRTVAFANPRVIFHGVADTTTLGDAYSQATVLVNPRQLSNDFVRYSFPSKLLEYMTTGTPVVTTHLPTIPPDYDPFLIYTDDDAASIAKTLDRTMANDDRELEAFGRAAQMFVRETRSPGPQGHRVKAFLESLSGLAQARVAPRCTPGPIGAPYDEGPHLVRPRVGSPLMHRPVIVARPRSRPLRALFPRKSP